MSVNPLKRSHPESEIEAFDPKYAKLEIHQDKSAFYPIERELIKGGYTTVYHIKGNPKIVCKQEDVSYYPQETTMKRVELFAKESSLSREISGAPHIPLLIDSFYLEGQSTNLILENVGKDIELTHLNPKKKTPLCEIITLGKKWLEALDAMHKKQIAHLDLKHNNLATNFIFDFGSSQKIPENLMNSQFGDFYFPYRAPEIGLGKAYGTKADIWSLACILFQLYTAEEFSGFDTEDDGDITDLSATIDAIHAHAQRFNTAISSENLLQDSHHDPEYIETLNQQLKIVEVNVRPLRETLLSVKGLSDSPEMVEKFSDLLEKMFQLNPNDRISAMDALNHPFFASEISFKLEVEGEKNVSLCLLDNDYTTIELIDLAKCKSNTCIHIPAQEKSCILQLYPTNNPMQTLTSVEIPLTNAGILKINTSIPTICFES
ncbi:MAG: hypothetical protein COT85_03705 [Chlamydiae bacterium CG10_big_fil_rev_8_21_14_0_10_42_34]|nr:MAG: hypothetical protein COT85_03705 [Chlamydiae bacterium CG10_big_fil_rev_8_21_14_0_10_42_34]